MHGTEEHALRYMVSFKYSINFNRVQNVSICGSSSAAIQNIGEHNIK